MLARCGPRRQGDAVSLEKSQIARRLRDHVRLALFDDSGTDPGAYAIYSLSDPRDARRARYIGQTNAPQRRFLQHLSMAKLWMPDEKPWWVKSPKLRPLSAWIRELYREEYRLPVMVLTAWRASIAEARLAERARIYECLQRSDALLNIEGENLGAQLVLI
jgi:hypothetical protein